MSQKAMTQNTMAQNAMAPNAMTQNAMTLDAMNLTHQQLNEALRAQAGQNISIQHCLGQRYIGAGMKDVDITVSGIPGNALGCFLSSGRIEIHGNAQDAVGDTMSGGTLIIHGTAGDALGYAMRGGEIYVQNDAGYRAGTHMKQHETHPPVIVIGGRAGHFLGEYQAGGIILVLGLGLEDTAPVGAFCGTGMHGGQIFIRSRVKPSRVPAQVALHSAIPEDMARIAPLITTYCEHFGTHADALMKDHFWCITPDSQNPYHRLYVPN